MKAIFVWNSVEIQNLLFVTVVINRRNVFCFCDLFPFWPVNRSWLMFILENLQTLKSEKPFFLILLEKMRISMLKCHLVLSGMVQIESTISSFQEIAQQFVSKFLRLLEISCWDTWKLLSTSSSFCRLHHYWLENHCHLLFWWIISCARMRWYSGYGYLVVC